MLQTTKYKELDEPSDRLHQYHDSIPFTTAPCRYAPVGLSYASKTQCWTQISEYNRIETESRSFNYQELYSRNNDLIRKYRKFWRVIRNRDKFFQWLKFNNCNSKLLCMYIRLSVYTQFQHTPSMTNACIIVQHQAGAVTDYSELQSPISLALSSLNFASCRGLVRMSATISLVPINDTAISPWFIQSFTK